MAREDFCRPEIDARLKTVRKQMKLCQTSFGKPLGLSTSSISYFEQGYINRKNCIAICQCYNINVVWLVEGRGEMFAPPKTLSKDEIIDTVKIALQLPPVAVDILQAYVRLGDDEKQLVDHAIQTLIRASKRPQ